ncbi:MAG: HAMP domain-containing protein [Acidobacteriia bacterium]|nr:HAMP domain-containing protein [Terriglobia bacterium]
MVRIRLRTKFLLSLIVTTALLTSVILVIVQNHIRHHARQEIYEALSSSVLIFQQFERQRERTLAQSAGLLADLPNLKALMTTHHEPTIQDASTDFWQLTGSDLFLLADRTGKVMALHTATAGFDRNAAQDSISWTLQRQQNRDWWYGGGHLYEVFLQPIYFGPSQDNVLLGVLAMGFEVDERLARVVARVASSGVAFRYGKDIVVSTLFPNQQRELAAHEDRITTSTTLNSEEIQLGGENFLGASLALAPSSRSPVTLIVLKSYDAATLFLRNLNRLLVGVGLIAVLAGSWLIFLISHTFTRPLSNLVAGVRALEEGDFAYPLSVRSRDEVGELTLAFDKMRKSLEKGQRDLLHAERLATIGRMASSISHDLRHPLTTILAYAEFLSESNLHKSTSKHYHILGSDAQSHLRSYIYLLRTCLYVSL